MKLAWATDIHLNHATNAAQHRFYQAVKDQADALLVTGDIAESPTIGRFLTAMTTLAERHAISFWATTIITVAPLPTRDSTSPSWWANSEPCLLEPHRCCRVDAAHRPGRPRWLGRRPAGRFEGVRGDPERLPADRRTVLLEGFVHAGQARLRHVLQALGDEAATHLKAVLPVAAEKYPHVIVATHVPPFREATWHEGRPSSDDFLPFFACKAVGDVLLEAAQSHPECQILVLCGHTHGGGEVQVLENLRVVTGPAEYGKPEIQRIIDVA